MKLLNVRRRKACHLSEKKQKLESLRWDYNRTYRSLVCSEVHMYLYDFNASVRGFTLATGASW